MVAMMVSAAVFAQNTAQTLSVETTKLVEKYALDAAQTKKMEKVVAQKAKNISQIESLKTKSPEKYRAKMQAILNGARASEGHILNTKAQKEAHQKMLVAIRERRAAKEMELKKQGAKKEAVEQALLDIEAEY